MKDNTGKLGVLDHSELIDNIMARLPSILGKSPGGPIFTISLDALKPHLVLNTLENPITVSSGGGYLYTDMNALDVDFSWLRQFLVNI